MLEKQPHNGQKQSSQGEGSIKWKTYSHLSYHCLFYEVKCFRKSAVLLCKSIGEDDSFATLFPYGGCCWSLDHIKNTPWCLYLVADTAPLCPCLWNVQFNQTKWPYFWACWEHWDHSSSGLFYMANDSGRTGFSIRSQWSGWISTCEYFPNLQKKGSWWCISHSSFLYTYCMLLWQSMCKCNFPGYLSERRMSHNYPMCRNQTDTNSDAAPVENIRQGSFGYSSPSVKQHAYSLI